VIAAGALYGLEHHRGRMVEDHANAQILAAAIRQGEGIALSPEDVDTNIVIFKVDPKLGTAAQFQAELKLQNVLALAISQTQVRLVTHLDVTEAQCREAGKIIQRVAGELAKGNVAAKELEAAY
jgi:threonine aldolase